VFNTLDNYQLATIFVVSLVAILGASEIGRLLGLRATGKGGQDVSTLEGAALGLLALMIGFTFAMALARFEARRDAVLDEANKIQTTALRSRMLPAPYAAEALKSLRDYTKIRLEFVQRLRSGADLKTKLADLKATIARSNEIQEALWKNAMAQAAKDNGLVPTGLFIQSLNEMIDSQEKRLDAQYARVPNVVILALYAAAIVAFLFAGYANGLQARRVRLPLYVMAVLVSTVILLIQDLDRPNTGFITISQQPMIDTAASIEAYANQP
jgi:hypothetical protein